MAQKLYLSSSLTGLLDSLEQQIEKNPIDPLKTRTILVPNQTVKQWLLLEIAKRKGIAMGLKVLEIEQLCPLEIGPLQLFCLIHAALRETTDPQLLSYLGGRKKRLLHLTEELTALVFKYGRFDPSLLTPPSLEKGWQQDILRKLFIEGPWRLPIQQSFQFEEPLICFGIDHLPSIYWTFLSSAPSLSIYLFSPCIYFWADISSERERRWMNRYWKNRGVSKKSWEQLETYLEEAPPSLANWGRLGRETLKLFDAYELETESNYPIFEPDTLLKQIQYDLLLFQTTESPKIDDSIQVMLTGSSKLREIEALRDEILRLNLPYHEISVLAPDICPYIPFIEFVFAPQIPYRIFGLDIGAQSSFREGMVRLLQLGSGRWEAEEVLSLFETPSFYRKQGWSQEVLAEYRSWISAAKIEWGFNQEHRKAVLQKTLGNKAYEDQGSWEKGLDWLLDAIVYFKPIQIHPDRFEQLLVTLSLLNELDLKGEKTLADWAIVLERAVELFLFADLEDEADGAVHSSFQKLLFDFKTFPENKLYSVDVIQQLLVRPLKAQIHTSQLHAVRFSSIEEGASIPAKALFLIGMDETSFPRMELSSSFDLSRQKAASIGDRDRYLFLKAIFSATDFLRISYNHLSADEGKSVGASLLVQELIGITGPEISTLYRPPLPRISGKNLAWPLFTRSQLPEGQETLLISDLRQLARHPWKFFLQKRHGIYLKEKLEESFALQKGQIIRQSLEKSIDALFVEANLPTGPFGKALEIEILEKAADWQSQLEVWQTKPFSLILRENCPTAQWEGSNYIVPPLQVVFDQLKIRLVGEIKQVSSKGLICTHEDTIGGALKVWPEALIVGLCLNTPQLLMLKSGKIKQIKNLEECLKSFICYYFSSLHTPSPLLASWADAILRKRVLDLEKTRGRDPLFEDFAADWVLARANVPSAEEVFTHSAPVLKELFSGLTELYPLRNHAVL
jgi:exodeoxyribonuclease V gamma subunit